MRALALIATDRRREKVRRIAAELGWHVEFVAPDRRALARTSAGRMLFVGDGVQSDRML
jgi:hypothetical protein